MTDVPSIPYAPCAGQADLPGFELVLVAGAVLKRDDSDQGNLFAVDTPSDTATTGLHAHRR